MHIIPVLDLLRGVVVRAVGGRREEYRPIQSLLTAQSGPPAVLDAILRHFEFRTAYVADLDGVMHGDPNFALIAELARRPIELMIDAGVKSISQAQSLSDAGAAFIVAASESQPNSTVLKELIRNFSPDRIVFSMDMKGGAPMVVADEWKSLDARDIVLAAAEVGVTRFILLDLADVGEAKGVQTLSLLTELRTRLPNSWFAVGGGVRNIDDVATAEQAGADAALVASALHDGRIQGCDWSRVPPPSEIGDS
jgi:phosphoribosylformimino-5-aminoimidazole carboxamide ribotide isomerase